MQKIRRSYSCIITQRNNIALFRCISQADAAKDVIEGDDVDLYELPPWRQMIMAFLKCDVARAQAAKDEVMVNFASCKAP